MLEGCPYNWSLLWLFFWEVGNGVGTVHFVRFMKCHGKYLMETLGLSKLLVDDNRICVCNYQKPPKGNLSNSDSYYSEAKLSVLHDIHVYRFLVFKSGCFVNNLLTSRSYFFRLVISEGIIMPVNALLWLLQIVWEFRFRRLRLTLLIKFRNTNTSLDHSTSPCR